MDMANHQSVAQLLEKMGTDEALREAMQNTSTPEDVVQAAAGAGVTVSVDEVQAFRRDVEAFRQKSANGEMSEADLEAVAGGFSPTHFLAQGILAGASGLSSLGLAGATAMHGFFQGRS